MEVYLRCYGSYDYDERRLRKGVAETCAREKGVVGGGGATKGEKYRTYVYYVATRMYVYVRA